MLRPCYLPTAAVPDLVMVGTGYTYLQEYAVHAAQAVVRAGLIDLVGLGMPTCRLYVGLDSLTQFATPTSSASVPFSLPSTPSLSGALILSQSATLTPGINAFGFATSNAVELLLGIN
jgi:hypothetical protein